MTYEPIWGSIIAWYLFLAGVGAGAFATSTFLSWRHPEATSMRKIGHVIAPVAVAVGLVLLMVDAEAGFHNPLRFVYLLGNFGSVMTWGVVFLGLFMVVSIAALVLDIMKRNVPRWLENVGAVLALCVAVYTGALLGVCNTFPLWNNALLPILFLVSALSTGAASVLCVSIVRHASEFNRVGVLKKFHFCLPVIELLLIASLLFITQSNSEAGMQSVLSLVSGEWAVWFWLGVMVIGLVAPTVLETWLLFFSSKEFETSRKAHWISFASDAGVLVGGFLLRFLIVSAAVPLTVVVPLL
ncbi:MAG: polysulfide reductase NrfD [Eggerthellaceae bacterium]|nr:polysulfide reductase NrfD [Eggerthellaceae bacterium]